MNKHIMNRQPVGAVEGMDVMDKISRVKTRAHGPFAADAPMTPVSIRSIAVIKTDN